MAVGSGAKVDVRPEIGRADVPGCTVVVVVGVEVAVVFSPAATACPIVVLRLIDGWGGVTGVAEVFVTPVALHGEGIGVLPSGTAGGGQV